MRRIGGRLFSARAILVSAVLASVATCCVSHASATAESVAAPAGSDTAPLPHAGKQHLGAPNRAALQQMCVACGADKVKFGIADSAGVWVKLFCKPCGRNRGDDVRSLQRMCAVCNTMGIFGPRGGVYGGILHCRNHRQLGEVDVKHRRCNGDPDCERWAAYGREGGIPERCRSHVCEGDVYLRKRHVQKQLTCSAKGCDKAPSFGIKGKAPMRCKTHMEENDQDIKHRLCEHPAGCSTQASYGSLSDRRRVYCLKHRLAKDKIGVRCKAASGNSPAGGDKSADADSTRAKQGLEVRCVEQPDGRGRDLR